MYSLWMVGCMFLIFSVVQAQEEVSIVATKDNTLFESIDGSVSNGAGIYLFAGKTNGASIRRGLVMFDLTSKIPNGATITSAKVHMNMSKSQTITVNVKLYKVLSSWGEGTSDATGNNGNEGSGATATTGDATWLHRLFNTETWTSPGGDFSATPSATTSVAGVGSYEFSSNDQMVADVTEWLNDSSTNNGWIVIGDESANGTAKRFDTKENSSAANRPTLIVQYTGPTIVGGREKNPTRFSLAQNFPNPFNPTTVIKYSIASSSHVTLKMYDVLGKEIAVLVNEIKEAGTFSYQLKTIGLASGIYFYRLQSGSNTATKKLVLTK
jgi:hypothetical protein